MRLMNSCVCGNDRMYLATRGSRPVSPRNSGTKCGLGRKRTSNTKSASSGKPCLYPKLTQETRIVCGLPDCCLNRSVVRPQLMNIELGRVDDQVGNLANRPQVPAFGSKRCPHRSVRPLRMRSPLLAETP